MGDDWTAFFRDNEAAWDARVPVHARSAFYDVDGFRRGASTLQAIELELVGDVAGKSLLHLQCHFGLDTLSWARRGARVVGIATSIAAPSPSKRQEPTPIPRARCPCGSTGGTIR
jgi:hypothetical protein